MKAPHENSLSAGFSFERLAGRMNHLLERYDTDKLIRHSLVVIVFTNLGSATNLLFHVIMGHMLTEGAYAVLATMLGIYLIFTTPTMALQNTLAHFSAHLKRQGREGDIRRLARSWMIKVSMILIPLAGLALLSASYWQSWMHLESVLPVVVVVLMVLLSYYLPVYVGSMQGVQAFVSMCLAANIWALLRIVIGVGLVALLGAAALYGLIGHLFGMGFSLLVGMLLFNRTISREGMTDLAMEKSDRYLIWSMVALFSFSILMTGDIVLVKIFFPNEADYGPYSRASTIARMLIFLSQPIANALFPKVISRGSRSNAHTNTLWRAITLSSLIIGAAVVFCLAIPRFPLFLLYHVKNADARLLLMVRSVSVAMAPLGLAFILLNFEMAQHRFTAIPYLLVFALVLIFGTVFFHQNLRQFVLVYMIASYGASAGILYAATRRVAKA
ncbi:MAG: hypothetical protein PHP44_06510 [Kiritimatiellae bacterium]|nr:hypothetical protein [Kiritimatiellia bacterium]MDD4735740.1 hypothetical protein [Kiritimatiellia bacterium]